MGEEGIKDPKTKDREKNLNMKIKLKNIFYRDNQNTKPHTQHCVKAFLTMLFQEETLLSLSLSLSHITFYSLSYPTRHLYLLMA
jgi:hypothetical protein